MKTTTKLLVILVILLTSCNKHVIQTMQPSDRLITGYSKNMKRYKVVNKYLKVECDIRIENSDTLKPGDILSLKPEFDLCH